MSEAGSFLAGALCYTAVCAGLGALVVAWIGRKL